MSATSPIVLVHGAWHGPWAWGLLSEVLRDAGRPVTSVGLTSSAHDPGSLGDLYADAALVARTLDGIDQPSVLVGHSYGGQVISQASAGRTDVAHLVYLCAFMMDVGESVTGASEGKVPGWFEIVADGAAIRPHDAAEIFYGGVAAELAGPMIEKLGLQSTTSFEQVLTQAGWHDIPSTYVVCERDRAISPSLQDSMAQRAGTVHRLAAAHSPFISMPERVAEIILSV